MVMLTTDACGRYEITLIDHLHDRHEFDHPHNRPEDDHLHGDTERGVGEDVTQVRKLVLPLLEEVLSIWPSQ
jgi:hypothetical protein